jgi:ribosomal-protein-alanine N-acetyltransferase
VQERARCALLRTHSMIVLETDRLLFRDHEIDDLEPYCAMEADAEVRRFVGGYPRTRGQAEEKFRRVYLPPLRNGRGLCATVFKPEGRYIGYCGVYSPHREDEGALGFYLARAYWGRGLATEAGCAFVSHGFEELGMQRIVASVETGNAASVRVLEKLGFAWVRHEKGEFRSFDHYELQA